MCRPPLLRDRSGAAVPNKDLTAARNEALWPPPPWLDTRLRRLLADPRDAPLLHVLLNAAVLLPPAALAVLVTQRHAAGCAYLALSYGVLAQRFLLALHYSQHRRLFRPGARGRVSRGLSAP